MLDRDKISVIENIYITLDSHNRGHIATASFWVDSTGLEPQPFSQITFDDIQIGKWMPKDNNLKVITNCFKDGEI